MFNWFSSPTVTNCTFSGNMAESYGGGMLNYTWSSATITNCTFSSNTTSRVGGGMFNYGNSSPTVTNCTFSQNSAIAGGGMFNYDNSSPTVTNCTFSGNTAESYSGGMFNLVNSNPIVTNCIFWYDTPYEIFNADTSIPIITYSDIQGGYSGIGNINSDPCFMDINNPDPNLWNLRLKSNSPCIDAGDNNSVSSDIADLDNDGNTIEPTPFDMDGFPRFIDDCWTVDTGNGTAPIVDMGAYEYLSSDIARSGHIDFLDFCLFATYWLDTNCGRCSGADLTCDGDVDFDDVQEFISHWMAGTQ
jgi:parallel beta-helix repeat protein